LRLAGIMSGMISSIFSIVLWVIFIFYNPYASASSDTAFITFFTLFLPACVALFASLTSKKYFMLVSFLWSAPISSYMFLSPGIFKVFGVTCLLYFIQFLMLFFYKNQRRVVC
jgi:hypothetical protein